MSRHIQQFPFCCLLLATLACSWAARADEDRQPTFCVTGLVDFVVGTHARVLFVSTPSGSFQAIDPRSVPADYRAGDLVQVVGRVTAPGSRPSRSADLIRVLAPPPARRSATTATA